MYFLLACLVFLAQPLWAQEFESDPDSDFDSVAGVQSSYLAIPEKASDFSSRGFRLGLVFPTLNFLLSEETGSQNQSLNSSSGLNGLSLGYISSPAVTYYPSPFSYLPALGYFGNFVVAIDSGFLSEKSFFRLEGGGVFAFNRSVNAKLGVNFSNIRLAESQFEYSPGLGLQAGLGFQINRRVGVDANYLVMNQTARRPKGSADEIIFAQETGVELGLHATF